MEHYQLLVLLLACYSLLGYSFFMYFFFHLIFFFLFSAMLCITVTQKRFHLVYCIVAIVIVCHSVRSLVTFFCEKIKGLLTHVLIRPCHVMCHYAALPVLCNVT